MSDDYRPFPLFKGACRLPTVAGIPRTTFILLGTLGASLFLAIKVWAFPFIFVAFVTCWSVTKYDDRAFRILGLWFKTKFANTRNRPFHQLWKASSRAPVIYRQRDLP